MSKFNLNNPAQFSQMASGALTDIASAFGLNPADWDIQEGSFNGVPFHVFKSSTYTPTEDPSDPSSEVIGELVVSKVAAAEQLTWQGSLPRMIDSGGRRKVKYLFPYRDGQTTDDLGRRPAVFEADIVLFGNSYMDGYNALLEQFNKTTPGLLLHPIIGKIGCVVDTYQITHESAARKAMAMRVTFIEHNFTVGDITADDSNTFKSLIAAALGIFAAIDTVINTINNAISFATGLKNLINGLVDSYKLSTAVVLSNMNQTFNASGSSADIPALLPVNLGGTGIATTSKGLPAAASADPNSPSSGGTAANANKPILVGSPVSASSTFVVVASVNDPFNGIPVNLLNSSTIVALAVTQITQQVQALRDQAAQIITLIEANGGALELFDQIMAIRQSVVQVQDVLEAGVASSSAQVTNYTTPRLMSIREVAFANGLTPELSKDIDLLNPFLDSVNFIPKGTTLKVPLA